MLADTLMSASAERTVLVVDSLPLEMVNVGELVVPPLVTFTPSPPVKVIVPDEPPTDKETEGSLSKSLPLEPLAPETVRLCAEGNSLLETTPDELTTRAVVSLVVERFSTVKLFPVALIFVPSVARLSLVSFPAPSEITWYPLEAAVNTVLSVVLSRP